MNLHYITEYKVKPLYMVYSCFGRHHLYDFPADLGATDGRRRVVEMMMMLMMIL